MVNMVWILFGFLYLNCDGPYCVYVFFDLANVIEESYFQLTRIMGCHDKQCLFCIEEHIFLMKFAEFQESG